jgi:hypothetical protein
VGNNSNGIQTTLVEFLAKLGIDEKDVVIHTPSGSEIWPDGNGDWFPTDLQSIFKLAMDHAPDIIPMVISSLGFSDAYQLLSSGMTLGKLLELVFAKDDLVTKVRPLIKYFLDHFCLNGLREYLSRNEIPIQDLVIIGHSQGGIVGTALGITLESKCRCILTVISIYFSVDIKQTPKVFAYGTKSDSLFQNMHNRILIEF